MKFSAVIIAFAAGASASTYYSVAQNTTSSAAHYVTEVVSSYETYCAGPTTLTYGTKTYTIPKETTFTITDCPCTISKPVYTTSVVECKTCSSSTSKAVSYPTTHANGTTPAASYSVKPTGATSTSKTATSVPTAAAGKLVALSGAGLAGVLGLVAVAL